MKNQTKLTHEFVDYIPDDLEEGVVYVCIQFATAVHKCFCGCGKEVVTPLSPTDWKIIFDGETISLDPSIGNWNFECQSHYWIRRNRVQWAPHWSRKEINAGRTRDQYAKDKYYGVTEIPMYRDEIPGTEQKVKPESKESVWQRLKKWLG